MLSSGGGALAYPVVRASGQAMIFRQGRFQTSLPSMPNRHWPNRVLGIDESADGGGPAHAEANYNPWHYWQFGERKRRQKGQEALGSCSRICVLNIFHPGESPSRSTKVPTVCGMIYWPPERAKHYGLLEVWRGLSTQGMAERPFAAVTLVQLTRNCT